MTPSPTNHAPLHRTIGAGYVREIHTLPAWFPWSPLEYKHLFLFLDIYKQFLLYPF